MFKTRYSEKEQKAETMKMANFEWKRKKRIKETTRWGK